MDGENIVTFASLDLDSRLLKAIANLNYRDPTLIQEKAIPLAISGKSIVARARTGSGKTAAYILPIIHKILAKKQANELADTPNTPGINALILVPTRELAQQVHQFITDISGYCQSLISTLNVSSESSNSTLSSLPDIVIATPKKFLNYIKDTTVTNLKETLESLVIDEADLILSFGYDEDVREICGYLPKIYQSYLMSATLNADVDQLKQLVVRNAVILRLEEEKDEQDLLKQYVIKCTQDNDKFLLTYFLLKLKVHPFGTGKTILFLNEIDRSFKLKLFLEQFGIKSCVLNSELPIKSRLHIVQEFNRGVYDILIATDQGRELMGEKDDVDDTTEIRDKKGNEKRKDDVEYGVSRGMDFQNVQAVINFDLPLSSRAYIHRVGRTARGVGNKGVSLSFFNDKEQKVFDRIVKSQKAMNREIHNFVIDMAQVDSFRYRIGDALRVVTKIAVKEARVKEIKSEILNNEKLKAHFEDNPKDLQALRHDKPTHIAHVQPHLKHVPSYLMPNKKGKAGVVKRILKDDVVEGESTNEKEKADENVAKTTEKDVTPIINEGVDEDDEKLGNVMFDSNNQNKKKRKNGNKSSSMKKKAKSSDPLKSFNI